MVCKYNSTIISWLDFQQSITKLPWQLPFTEKTLCQMTACKKVFFGKILENYCIM